MSTPNVRTLIEPSSPRKNGQTTVKKKRPNSFHRFAVVGGLAGAVLLVVFSSGLFSLRGTKEVREIKPAPKIDYLARQGIETSGYQATFTSMMLKPWRPDATPEECAELYLRAFSQGIECMDWHSMRQFHPVVFLQKASLYHSRGKTDAANKVLEELQSRIAGTPNEPLLYYTILYYQGVTALRKGENENCIMCRGESSCILPILPSARHINPAGSRLAIKYFEEYLSKFPDDLGVKWLLNLAYMTLGEHPAKVNPKYLLNLDPWLKTEFDVGQFRDVGHLVGVNRLNQSGGAIMEDFDNDGLLDIAVTCWAPSEPMAIYRNLGDGKFEDRTAAAGLEKQLGGLYCVQTDYNNDGFMDIFIPRGSWMPKELSQRPSLLKNNRDGTFTDVTAAAGLLALTNSTSATWADYDNDGWLDLFICCRKLPCLLYRNKGNGTFEEVLARSGLPKDLSGVLGATWIDVNNDGYPELFVNIAHGIPAAGVEFDPAKETARLFRNNRDGTFSDETQEMGIDGPVTGFSCWSFDFDNDGWLDIFATSGNHTLEQVIQGMLDLPCDQKYTARLYRNREGRGFQDITSEAGVDKTYSPMGSNFGDLDNDGYLDFMLGTGDPELSTLVPKRVFKNVAGKRFSEVSASTRMGHLQKGHGIAFGDWDRNGSQDILIELGGAIHGDRYHNVLYQNPGHGNNWLSVKLIGQKSNRAAIGARIKVVTDTNQTIHRHVTSGSSFGANPLEQHFGLGKGEKVTRLEIYWPTTGETQVFQDVAVNQGVVVTEFSSDYQVRTWKPIELPE